MFLQNLEARIDAAFVRVIQSNNVRFPFASRYLPAVRTFAAKNSERLRAEWERFYQSGDAGKLIDFLIDFARGNLSVGFPWSLLAGPFLEALRKWLHANPNILREPVGSTIS